MLSEQLDQEHNLIVVVQCDIYSENKTVIY